jgi:ATP-dependent Clp protease ATP-binding subunit ClpA
METNELVQDGATSVIHEEEEEEEEEEVTKQEDEGEEEAAAATSGNSFEVLVGRAALASKSGNKNGTKSRSRSRILLRNSPTGGVTSVDRGGASVLLSSNSNINNNSNIESSLVQVDLQQIPQGRRRWGSALHRNNQRSQRLLSLNTKEKIRRLLLGNQFESAKGKESSSRDLEIPGAGSEQLAIFKETEPFLYYQVQNEDLGKRDSAILKEINKLIEPYAVASGESLRAQKFPLEVRLQNVTYTVADEAAAADQGSSSQKIQTVFNTSVFYAAYAWLRRLVQCQDDIISNKTLQVPRKSVLEDINLVIQPGKQYLLLGPPGSGKSTLLKTIAGLIRHDEDDDVGQISTSTSINIQINNVHPSLQGEILYNGRSLKVRIGLDWIGLDF